MSGSRFLRPHQFYDSSCSDEKHSLCDDNLVLKLNVIRSIKTFQGDIWGFYRNDFYLPLVNSEINCRLDTNLVEIFLRTISENFIVLPNNLHPKNSYLLVSKYYRNVKHIIVNISSIARQKFRYIVPDFDVEGLTMNNSSRWVRCSVPGLKLCDDKVSWLENRILNRKFCLLEKCVFKPSSTISELVEKSIAMIRNGWIMDDMMLPDTSWLVCCWLDLVKTTSFIRTGSNNGDDWIKNDMCNICQTKFKPNDIIINLSCGHNFHWECEPGGLKQWINGQSKKTCPNCRKTIS